MKAQGLVQEVIVFNIASNVSRQASFEMVSLFYVLCFLRI